MRYMGGKGRIVKYIAPILIKAGIVRSCSRYVEPFLGGAYVFAEVAPSFTMAEAGDASPDLILMWSAVRDGWIPPDAISREEYESLRHSDPSPLRAFAGFGHSFGAKWFGGYAEVKRYESGKDTAGATRLYDYAGAAKRGIAKKAPGLADAKLNNCDYAEWRLGPGDLVYCDPPYANTQGYGCEWDSSRFWSQARMWAEAGATVFVSEYCAPTEWVSVWSREVKSTVDAQTNRRVSIEHLFTWPQTTTCVDGSLMSQVLSPPMTEPTPPADDAPAAAPSNAKLDVKEIQDRNAEHRGRVIATATGSMFNLTDDEAAPLIAAAMTELAAVWREQAAYFTAAKRRGWKSTAEQHTQAAAMLAGFAGQLTTRPVAHATVGTNLLDSDLAAANPKPMAEQIDDAFGCSHPPEAISVLPGGERLCTTCRHRWTVEVETQASLFSGGAEVPVGGQIEVGGVTFTKIGESPFPAEQEAVIAMLDASPQPQVPLFVSPTSALPATAAAGNPFVSPGPMGGRAQVRRLTFSELPALIAQLPVRDTLSHSFVESYGNCSLQTLLDRAGRRGLGGITASRPSFSLIGGTAFHVVIETIERAVIDSNGQDIPKAMGNPGSGGINVEQVWAEALNLALAAVQQETAGGPYDDMSAWHVSQGGKEGYDWWRVTGSDMVRMYLDYHDAEYRRHHGIFRGIDPGQPDVMIEREFTTTFGHTATKGFLDQAWVVFPKLTPSALPYIEIRDAKTGSREPKETLQLAEYAYAVAEAYPQVAQRPIMGSFWMARKGIYTTSVDLFRRHPREELAYRFDAANAGQRAGLYTPNVTDLCVACSKRDYCPAQGRS